MAVKNSSLRTFPLLSINSLPSCAFALLRAHLCCRRLCGLPLTRKRVVRVRTATGRRVLCISPRGPALLRSFRPASRDSRSRTAFALLRAHLCCRRLCGLPLTRKRVVRVRTATGRRVLCISPRGPALLRSFRPASRDSRSRTAFALLRAHLCCRRLCGLPLTRKRVVRVRTATGLMH